MILQETWGNQASNIRVTLKPDYSFSVSFTSKDGVSVSGINIGSDYVATWLSGLPDKDGGGDGSIAERAGWLEASSQVNDATIGGTAAGLKYSTSTFRLTNGSYNGYEFSPKIYSSGWRGGSRAGITTYEAAGAGEGSAGGGVIIGIILGAIDVSNGYSADGGQYGTNAQLATGRAVGGILYGFTGAEIGAGIGFVFGSLLGGVGGPVGAWVGGVVGGWLAGTYGAQDGENTVRSMQQSH